MRERGARGAPPDIPQDERPPAGTPPPLPHATRGRKALGVEGAMRSAAQQRSGFGKLPERAERDEVRTHALGAQARNGRELKIIAVLCHTSLNLSSRKL